MWMLRRVAAVGAYLVAGIVPVGFGDCLTIAFAVAETKGSRFSLPQMQMLRLACFGAPTQPAASENFFEALVTAWRRRDHIIGLPANAIS